MDRPGIDANGARVIRAALTLAAAVGAAVVLLALVHDATRDRVTASERAHRAAAFDRVLGNASYDNDLLADRIEVRDPEPIALDAEALASYAGNYQTIASICEVTVSDGSLLLDARTKPEMLEQLGEDEPDEPPMPLGVLAGAGDRYVVVDGPAKGMKGYFRRAADGAVDALHVGGRLAVRVRP